MYILYMYCMCVQCTLYVSVSPQYGPIEKMNVCDNLGDHLVGNVYIKVWQSADQECLLCPLLYSQLTAFIIIITDITSVRDMLCHCLSVWYNEAIMCNQHE